MEIFEIKRVWSVYFSPTGTTKKIVTTLANTLAQSLLSTKDTQGDKADKVGEAEKVEKVEQSVQEFDFTLPDARTQKMPPLSASDFVVLGTPVYAGRVPNVLLKYLSTLFTSNTEPGAVAMPVSVYGNRNYDDALVELKDILEEQGFRVVAAAAFIGEHSFSKILAKGRPDALDLETARRFAEQVAQKTLLGSSPTAKPLYVKGVPKPYRGYYQPRNADGSRKTPEDMRAWLQIRPAIVDKNQQCGANGCHICAEVCPMGSIFFDESKAGKNAMEYRGICIKCGACVKKCPQKIRGYQDAAYLHHKRELEEELTRRAEPELFI